MSFPVEAARSFRCLITEVPVKREMRAGMPSLDGVASLLCESPEGRAIRGRSVRRSVSSGASNSLPSSFFTITDSACVARAAKAPDCKSGSPTSDTAGSSPAACKFKRGRSITGNAADSKPASAEGRCTFDSCRPCQIKGVSPKRYGTTPAHVAGEKFPCGFDSHDFRHTVGRLGMGNAKRS